MVTYTPEQISQIQAQERKAQEAQRERRAAAEEDRSTGLEHLPIRFLCGDINAQFAAFCEAQAAKSASQVPAPGAEPEQGVEEAEKTEVSPDANARGAMSSASTMSAESVEEAGEKAQAAKEKDCAGEEALPSVPEAAEPARGGTGKPPAETPSALSPSHAPASPVLECAEKSAEREAVQPKPEASGGKPTERWPTGWEACGLVVAHLILPPGVKGCAPLTRVARQTLQAV